MLENVGSNPTSRYQILCKVNSLSSEPKLVGFVKSAKNRGVKLHTPSQIKSLDIPCSSGIIQINEIRMDMQEVKSLFESKIQNLFTDKVPELRYNIIKECKILGGKTLRYDFGLYEGYNNIFHNAKGLIVLSIDNKDRHKDYDDGEVEVNCVLFDYRLRDAGIKFRKINAKNYIDAIVKIETWFEKNAEAIKKVY